MQFHIRLLRRRAQRLIYLNERPNRRMHPPSYSLPSFLSFFLFIRRSECRKRRGTPSRLDISCIKWNACRAIIGRAGVLSRASFLTLYTLLIDPYEDRSMRPPRPPRRQFNSLTVCVSATMSESTSSLYGYFRGGILRRAGNTSLRQRIKQRILS